MIDLIVVCRKASDYLKHGNVYGYNCDVCSEPLQVTPGGVEAIAKGGAPFCNACGFALVALLEKDAGVLLEKGFSPVALEQIAERLRKAQNN